MRWPWSRRQPEAVTRSIADPTLAAWFSTGQLVDLAGVTVSETSMLGLSALYRAVNLIAGTLASLPLVTSRESDTARIPVASVFDDPDPGGQTKYEWVETAFLHLLIHGRCGALKRFNAAGGLAGLPLIHPVSWAAVEPAADEHPVGGLWFDVLMADGSQRRFDGDEFWHVPGPSLVPQRGMALLAYGRSSFGVGIAAETAAGASFGSGATISGLATPADDYDITDDLPELRRQLNRSTTGPENAGAIAVVNRRLNFTPWTMTARDAQFLESRQFQVEEIARWSGVPPHLLMQTDKQTSWGTGVDEQNRGLSRFVLGHWASRFEQRASRLLARPRTCAFDFSALERPNHAIEVGLIISQVQAGLMTEDEGRIALGRKPLGDGGGGVPGQ